MKLTNKQLDLLLNVSYQLPFDIGFMFELGGSTGVDYQVWQDGDEMFILSSDKVLFEDNENNTSNSIPNSMFVKCIADWHAKDDSVIELFDLITQKLASGEYTEYEPFLTTIEEDNKEVTYEIHFLGRRQFSITKYGTDSQTSYNSDFDALPFLLQVEIKAEYPKLFKTTGQ